MSELTTTARPYARAAFDIAEKNNEQQKWSEMFELMATVAYDPTMRAVLDSPRLSQQQSAELFIAVCEQHINERAKNFIKLLAKNDRITLLPEIAALFQHYLAEAEGTVDAEVIAASEVSEIQLEKIAASLKQRLGKEVRVSSRIDDSLIGGAIIRAGDLVIDGSIRGRVNKLSNALTN